MQEYIELCEVVLTKEQDLHVTNKTFLRSKRKQQVFIAQACSKFKTMFERASSKRLSPSCSVSQSWQGL